MIPSTEERKAYMREWYRKHKEEQIEKSKKYQKDNNYACQKTEEAKRNRVIKRKTRRLFPITNQKCGFCILPAIERHHNTTPIKFDKFDYVCHNCHMEKDLEMNNHTKVK